MDIKILQDKANALIRLRETQRQLAILGQHNDALQLGRKIKAYTRKIARDYLEVKEVPDGPNEFLIEELSVVCASIGTTDKNLRSRLRLAAWNDADAITKKLETAYEALPNLEKVLEILR